MKLPIHEIAHTVYAATAAYDTARDITAPKWDETDARTREALYNEVQDIINGGATPAAAHDAWVREQVTRGWKKGAKFDAEKKTDPRMVAYGELPEYVRTRDAIVRAVVGALK